VSLLAGLGFLSQGLILAGRLDRPTKIRPRNACLRDANSTSLGCHIRDTVK
jgi:hypothetical protein